MASDNSHKSSTTRLAHFIKSSSAILTTTEKNTTPDSDNDNETGKT
jgi:hypothetical protein